MPKKVSDREFLRACLDKELSARMLAGKEAGTLIMEHCRRRCGSILSFRMGLF